MKRMLVWSGVLLFAVSCFAQKNELDMVVGNTWSFNSKSTITPVGFAPFTFNSGIDSKLTYELGVARQLVEFKPATLSLELTVAGFPRCCTNFASVFVVPAAKFSFFPRSRISPFASTGVGFVHLAASWGSSNAVAYQFGGGVNAKTPVHFLSFRVEARDFLASQAFVARPGFTLKQSSRNHAMAGAGFVVRF